jgi:hypothetical protein
MAMFSIAARNFHAGLPAAELDKISDRIPVCGNLFLILKCCSEVGG